MQQVLLELCQLLPKALAAVKVQQVALAAFQLPAKVTAALKVQQVALAAHQLVATTTAVITARSRQQVRLVVAQLLNLTAAQQAKCTKHLRQAAALATDNLEDFPHKIGLATQVAASPLQRPHQQLGTNTQIIPVLFSAVDPTSSTHSNSSVTEIAGVVLAGRQYLAAVAYQAAMRLIATMPTHLLPAQALVRVPKVTDFIKVLAAASDAVGCSSSYNHPSSIPLLGYIAWQIAKVGRSVLQRTDHFWVLAWASAAMGTVAALEDQWWCSALMGAAASSPSLL